MTQIGRELDHLARRVEKGKLSSDDMQAALKRVHATSDLGHAAGKASVVIEAVVEDLDVKRQVFVELERRKAA